MHSQCLAGIAVKVDNGKVLEPGFVQTKYPAAHTSTHLDGR
jgi:hypothetical protein